VYDDGPDVLTQRRLEKMKELGIVDKDVSAPPPQGHIGEEWKGMSPDDQKYSAKKMEAYAAMVDVIDTNVGRVMEHLRSTGELDNTFVLFCSDNGAEGAKLEAVPVCPLILPLEVAE
jgi:arylsulfatase A-like enzyme